MSLDGGGARRTRTGVLILILGDWLLKLTTGNAPAVSYLVWCVATSASPSATLPQNPGLLTLANNLEQKVGTERNSFL